MKERPILFNGEMVRGILDGRKTQTRRVVKENLFDECICQGAPAEYRGGCKYAAIDGHPYQHPPAIDECPLGTPGDRLWVREAWAQNANQLSDTHMDTSFVYRADGEQRALDNGDEKPWRPSIHMPRRASRIALEVVGVRVERLRAISEADATAEGVSVSDLLPTHKASFYSLWDSICKPGETVFCNPWVWVVEFKRV